MKCSKQRISLNNELRNAEAPPRNLEVRMIENFGWGWRLGGRVCLKPDKAATSRSADRIGLGARYLGARCYWQDKLQSAAAPLNQSAFLRDSGSDIRRDPPRFVFGDQIGCYSKILITHALQAIRTCIAFNENSLRRLNAFSGSGIM